MAKKYATEAVCLMCGGTKVIATAEDDRKFAKQHQECEKKFRKLSLKERESRVALSRPPETLRVM